MSESESWLRNRRRLLVLLLVVLLALAGAGIGSFVLDEDDYQPGLQTPTANETVDLTLSIVEGDTLLAVSNVTPDQSGATAIRLRNDGASSGFVRIANVSITEQENGFHGPESAVDSSIDAGELAENTMVNVSFRRGSDTTPLFTTAPDQSLAAVGKAGPSDGVVLESGETVTVALEWRIPAGTSNEIQSDSARVDVAYELLEVNATTS